jgi:hypothetical protein
LNLAGVYGQLSVALVVGAGISFVPLPNHRLIGWFGFMAAFLALGPLLYGLIGSPSFTLTQLALVRLTVPDKALAWNKTFGSVLTLVVGAIFYPLALGVGPFDPFDLGYRPRLLLICLAALGLVFALRRETFLVLLTSADAMAYGTGLFSNLWSACLDPILVVLALLYMLRAHFKGRAE